MGIDKIRSEQNKKLIHFFKNVIIQLGYYDWKIEFTHDSYCWKYRKTITISDKVKNKKQMILHEVAHISTCRFCNQKHNYKFWKHFKDLMKRFLPSENMCQEQMAHRKFATKGKYSLVYAD